MARSQVQIPDIVRMHGSLLTFQSESFGWVEDGIRGHVFVTEDNSTIVVALKGTSAALLPGGGETAKRDKMNVSSK